MQAEIESPQVTEVKRKIRALTSSILRCGSKNEADSYRPQLQREERKLSQLMMKANNKQQ
jgi:hypothetical protein